jgi:hypothetical protein
VLLAACVLGCLRQKPGRTLKKRSAAGIAEVYKELTIRLEKFKTDIEGTTSESVTSVSLRRMWENKAEWICRETLNLADKFMEESELGCQQESKLNLIKSKAWTALQNWLSWSKGSSWSPLKLS